MNVLIAYDGSACSEEAIADLHRAGLGDGTHATVISVADVWPRLLDENPPDDDPLSNPAIQHMSEKMRAQARQAFEDAKGLAAQGAGKVSALFPRWTIVSSAEAGSPYSVIVEKAEAISANLIVVGSHGRSAVGRAFLGSVSQKILHHAHCSVRVGRCSNMKDVAAGRPVKIIVGTDGSRGAAGALDAVLKRTWPAGSAVRIVSACDPRPLLPLGPAFDIAPAPLPESALRAVNQTEIVQRMLAAAAEKFAGTGLDVSTSMPQEEAKRGLLSEAEQWGADCIFLGAQGLTAVERFLMGSVSSAVAARANCTVEVIRA